MRGRSNRGRLDKKTAHGFFRCQRSPRV